MAWTVAKHSMKLIALGCCLFLFAKYTIGQIRLVDGDTISAEVAQKHINSGRLFYLTSGEFATTPYLMCEEEIWAKFGCQVFHVSNFGVSAIDEYNEVVFQHLQKTFGEEWQSKKDSLMQDCEENNVCGIDINKWHFTSYGPDIQFDQNSFELSQLGKCLISDFYYPLFLEAQDAEPDMYISVYGSIDPGENTDSLAQKRCESVYNYLVNQGDMNLDTSRIIMEGMVKDIYYDDPLPDQGSPLRDWNRVVFFTFYSK